MTTKKRLSIVSALALTVAAIYAAGQSTTTPPMSPELKSLQGYWEGDGAGGKCYITITNNILHYRNAREWFKTTFTLPDNTSPRQLHATIKNASGGTNSVGEVVHAIFKVEADTLTLATIDPNATPAQDFQTAQDRYTVKKTTPPKDHTLPACNPTPKTATEPTVLDNLLKSALQPAKPTNK